MDKKYKSGFCTRESHRGPNPVFTKYNLTLEKDNAIFHSRRHDKNIDMKFAFFVAKKFECNALSLIPLAHSLPHTFYHKTFNTVECALNDVC